KEIMMLLLEKRGAEVVITEEVVKAAAENRYSGKEIMMLLLEKRGAEVVITEEVVKAAAENRKSGSRLLNSTTQPNLGKKNKIQRLLKRGVESDLSNPRKVTPLWIAATNGHIEVVRLLLETKSVNVNATSVSGRSPIFYPAVNGHEEIVKLLLNTEANPTFIDTEGDTALLVS
ncbi:b7a5bf77-39d6-4c44-a99b-040df980e6b2, partial [Sclerotinia trifoliorum]